MLLMKYHQAFKEEFKNSIFQLSSDSDCSCKIHSCFGIKFRDESMLSDSGFEAGNNFSIQLDVSLILDQLRKKDFTKPGSLNELEGMLFYFYQNTRLKTDLTNKDLRN
mmetsp:Transcript_41364/g.47685  ORF Transcript_41364/g.47685 Transcript_41364/m.47685 type:complete len:108 (-) Transcript_41364:671-994(-)